MGLPRQRRLTKRGDFARVMDEGRARTNPLVVLRFSPNDLRRPRLGFTASRRVGKAVRRNRAKRLLRDAVRQTPLEGGWDLVFIARPDMVQADSHAVYAAVREVLLRSPIGRPERLPPAQEMGKERP